MMYDLIGDIHGYASVLERLLRKLGYEHRNGSWRHPDRERRVVFVGDYIDRGPEIRETLHLVRSMVEAGQAVALMGNHEFNAILFNEPDGKGGYLRPHSAKNLDQHGQTLDQFRGREEEYASFVDWFRALPLFYETEDLRAVHACWDPDLVDALRAHEAHSGDAVLSAGSFREAGDPDSELYEILEDLLKGREAVMPEGKTFRDKDGRERREMRVKWWIDPASATMAEWGMNEVEGLDHDPLPPEHRSGSWYREHYRPVFFGHYWLTGTPRLQRSNVCCLDYSIGKREKLVAYRFEGENELSEEKLEWIGL